MYKLSSYIRIGAALNYMACTEDTNLTQFTRNFKLEYSKLDKETLIHFEEDLVTILEIMNPKLIDFKFFMGLCNLLQINNTYKGD